MFQGDSSVQYYFPRTCLQSFDKQLSLQPEILSSTQTWNSLYSFATFMIFMLNLAYISWLPLVYKWASPKFKEGTVYFPKAVGGWRHTAWKLHESPCECCLLTHESSSGSVVFSKWVIINEINKTWSQFLYIISTGTLYAFLLEEFKVSPWVFRMPNQYLPTAKKELKWQLYTLQVTLVINQNGKKILCCDV